MEQDNGIDDALLSLHRSVTVGIDRLFVLAFNTYADEIDDHKSIYHMFVAVLAQTMGRHLAGFPESERIIVENEALAMQDAMMKETLQSISNRKSELHIQNNDPDSPYDLTNMKPAGNA